MLEIQISQKKKIINKKALATFAKEYADWLDKPVDALQAESSSSDAP